jgi:hypothetical protein
MLTSCIYGEEQRGHFSFLKYLALAKFYIWAKLNPHAG